MNEVNEEMKQIMAAKTECMIESYTKVLVETKTMFEAGFNVEPISSVEIAKRADMFWNIALQQVQADKVKYTQPQPQYRSQQETPCAKKSRESATKIAMLEAEVLESKGK